MRILHSGAKAAQEKGESRNHGIRIHMFLSSLGAMLLAGLFVRGARVCDWTQPGHAGQGAGLPKSEAGLLLGDFLLAAD